MNEKKEEEKMKFDCYSCIYRREVPGSAHSCCHHPANKEILNNLLLRILGTLAGGGAEPINFQPRGLTVIGDPVGIRNGWFNYPFNYDPIWLRFCSGKKEKRKDESNH